MGNGGSDAKKNPWGFGSDDEVYWWLMHWVLITRDLTMIYRKHQKTAVYSCKFRTERKKCFTMTDISVNILCCDQTFHNKWTAFVHSMRLPSQVRTLENFPGEFGQILLGCRGRKYWLPSRSAIQTVIGFLFYLVKYWIKTQLGIP